MRRLVALLATTARAQTPRRVHGFDVRTRAGHAFKCLDVYTPAFPDEAYSVVAPMRDAQAPDTCRTSKGATTRLAACSFYHATEERGHPKAFRRGGRAHPIFSPHRAKVLHGPARGATLDDAAHFVHFTGRYLCGNQSVSGDAAKF